jgi:hypothetical protein
MAVYSLITRLFLFCFWKTHFCNVVICKLVSVAQLKTARYSCRYADSYYDCYDAVSSIADINGAIVKNRPQEPMETTSERPGPIPIQERILYYSL